MGRTLTRSGSLACTMVALLAIALLGSCNVESSHLAYVTVGNGGVMAFRIRNGSGRVTSIFSSPFLTGDSAAGIVVHPSEKFAYVANQQDGSISLLQIDETSGALTEKPPRTRAGIAPGPLALDPAGAFLYVADQSLDQILVFSVGANGSLSEVSSAQLQGTPTGLTLASSGYLFVPVPTLSDIYEFSINSGNLTQVCSGSGPVCLPFNVSDGVGFPAVDPKGKFLFVPNPNTSTVSAYAILGGGVLAPVPGAVFSTGICTTSTTASCPVPVAAAVNPVGNYLYVTNATTNTVAEFTIEPTTGELTPFLTPTQGVPSSPEFLVFDPDHKYLYVTSSSSGNITQYFVLSNGILSGTSNSIAAGSTPRAIAFTSQGP
jgi:6-phosphogluconolactonase